MGGRVPGRRPVSGPAGGRSAGGRRERGRQVAGGPEASSGPLGGPTGRWRAGGKWAGGPKAVVGARGMGSGRPGCGQDPDCSIHALASYTGGRSLIRDAKATP